ncbi:FAD-binding oxidoreductase [Pseudofrankia inefficax]|uniref:Delta(24)-sterol reductase n=1 Tax=Pseudofrankia inefficax (strain DSM 45817 / CECT 9037 / DDB 130130 / EuI1c) TaxID=298654 RepID=E3J6I4_PSEI1|nr:FAD-binding oxidoreductase [Pseudofrankia inefficax]ADP80760.1 FAD linked oxidase domain protein [Pseudofrankia inefficax]
MTTAGRRAAYERDRERLVEQYAAIPAGSPVRLAKRTSNLFRPRARHDAAGMDVSAFSGVLEVDAPGRTADVLGMTTYEDLVAATLPHGLMPQVVPQLKTITIGGAVTGLGIESTSFRNGLVHESVTELEVITGDGRLVVATPSGEHTDLLRGFPNSFGTLGYALRVKIELERVRPYVALRHLRFTDAARWAEAAAAACTERSYDGEPVDFCDGVWFGATECYLTLGRWTDDGPAETTDYVRDEIYYRSIQRRGRDVLPVADYLWRWDADWFWCSRVFGVQRPAVRRFVPRRWLRSDVYWRLMMWEQRHGVKRAVDLRRGRPDREDVIQDVEVPVGRLTEFLEVLAREVPIAPVWLCPLRAREPAAVWPLYRMDAAELYVNVGIWSSVALAPGEPRDAHNRFLERLVADLGGRKSLYSTSYYSQEEFWATYGGTEYTALKKAYDPDGRLLDLYAKTVEGR